ncbi:hypothetical protein BT63DRAFT_444115 [Microthyrium microscopicum]|uniref:Glyoxalase-like domain-containing protein n=1 Tax=Microthyrium microscopicum TaxID=703497 RepID=A0A6A6TYI6_9PEZI|nr:hypothetical protein BT63DRAFT_444115 [Microthyrium microscopicum]
MAPSTLDHIIILLPSLENIPPILNELFTITPGGTHGDGLTANALIPLRSGTYIELISFVNEDRGNHWWANKPAGLIDWCLTPSNTTPLSTTLGSLAEPISPNPPGLDTRLNWDQPIPGQRTRLDGQVVKWQVVFPSPSVARGSVPFFCIDETPRELRTGEGEHACKAVGIAAIFLAVNTTAQAKAYVKVYGTLVNGGEDTASLAEIEDGWSVEVGHPKDGVAPACKLNVCMPKDDLERDLLEKQGGQAVMTEIVLWVDGDEVPEVVEEMVEGNRLKMRFKRVPKTS